MVIRRRCITLTDVYCLTALPLLFILLSGTFTILQVMVTFLIIMILISKCRIERSAKPKFGNLLYERHKPLNHKRFLSFIGLQICLVIIHIMLKNIDFLPYDGLFLIIISNIYFMTKTIRSNVKVKLYTNGIIYKGSFFKYSELKEAMVVKNYENYYEYHMNRFKCVLIISAEEMKIVKTCLEMDI